MSWLCGNNAAQGVGRIYRCCCRIVSRLRQTLSVLIIPGPDQVGAASVAPADSLRKPPLHRDRTKHNTAALLATNGRYIRPQLSRQHRTRRQVGRAGDVEIRIHHCVLPCPALPSPLHSSYIVSLPVHRISDATSLQHPLPSHPQFSITARLLPPRRRINFLPPAPACTLVRFGPAQQPAQRMVAVLPPVRAQSA